MVPNNLRHKMQFVVFNGADAVTISERLEHMDVGIATGACQYGIPGSVIEASKRIQEPLIGGR